MENKQQKTQYRESVLSKFSGWIVSKLKSFFLGRYLTSYDTTNDAFRRGIKRLKRPNSQKRTKRTIARAMENNPLVKVVPKIQQFLLTVSVRDYGLVLFTMALISGALFFVQDYIPVLSWSLSSLITSIVIAVVALPMLFSKKSIARILFEWKLFSSILFNFLGISDEPYRYTADDEPHSSSSIALLCGLVLGAISYFLTPLGLLALITLIFLAYNVLITPEVGIVLMILSLPFSSVGVMSGLGLYVTLCYIIKCISGRRTFKFEYADLWMLIISLVVVYGGFMSYDIASSSRRMLISIFLLSMFFVISNLVRSKEWYRRCVLAFAISSTLASAIGIVQFVLGKFDIVWDKMEAFAVVHQRASSTFSDPDSFALYVIASLSFLLLFILSGKSANIRAIGAICSLINIVALVLTFSKVGFIGAIAMLIFMLLIFNRNSVYFILACFIAGTILHFALPTQMLERFFALFATPTLNDAYRAEAWASFVEVIKHHPFGIGLGDTSLSLALTQLTGKDMPIENLYLRFTMSCGIVGTILLVGVIIVMLRVILSYCAKTSNRLHRINAIAGFVGAFGIFASGIYSNAFEDPTIIALVAICLALTYAYIKIEREVFNALKLNHTTDYLTASIDIELDKDAAQSYVPTRKYVHSPRKRGKKKNESIDEESEIEGIKSNELDPVIKSEE